MPATRIDPDPGALGAVWVCCQSARLRQMDVQFGRHFHVDRVALLERASRLARVDRPGAAPLDSGTGCTDRFRRATIEAIDLCAKL